MAFLQQNTNDRLSAGNGNAFHDGMIWRNDQKLSLLGNFTSEATSDNPSERRRAGKSLSVQNTRKRKRALESHRRVNKNFLPSASFRCSWEGPHGCLSPKGCAPQCQRKHRRCLAARTEMRLKYLRKDLEVHGGKRQWEPHAEEQQRGCPGVSCAIAIKHLFTMANHLLTVRLGLGCWIQRLLQQWSRALDVYRCIQMPLGIA